MHDMFSGDVPPGLAGSRLTIDLGALADNWRFMRAASGTAECAAVVKADAYGVGQGPATRALAAAGCRTFFVAHASEALRLRADVPGACVWLLNGLPPGAARRLAAAGVRPVLASPAQLEEWRREAGGAPAGVQVDTGMNRLGLTAGEAAALAASPPEWLELVMSHFIASEEPANPRNAVQIARFTEIVRPFPPRVRRSLANSSGVMLPQAPHFDLTRPGYALYGGNPTPERPNPMRPVVRLEARIIQVREVAAGDTVGYNARWRAPGPARVAILSLGYADGFPRAGSVRNDGAAQPLPGGAALVSGRLCPFAGAVSMDLAAADVSALPAGAVRAGDWATVIGDALDVDTVAARLGTIGYEILTSLGRRHARIYAGAPAAAPAAP
ncbi:alanine racemase [Camelimonas abortus]|uniref:Alanine racemase n=1 Tax=Camelimonas abortus TaxID=1017184 RepID=A0ABV7LC47_9HYPH